MARHKTHRRSRYAPSYRRAVRRHRPYRLNKRSITRLERLLGDRDIWNLIWSDKRFERAKKSRKVRRRKGGIVIRGESRRLVHRRHHRR